MGSPKAVGERATPRHLFAKASRLPTEQLVGGMRCAFPPYGFLFDDFVGERKQHWGHV